jgi:hypothetical protein
MLFMNQWEVEEARERYASHAILGPATTTLYNLMRWANANSDGWAYWPKPTRAAAQLMELVQNHTRDLRRDGHASVSTDDLKRAYRPIKAFRTRQNADFEIV